MLAIGALLFALDSRHRAPTFCDTSPTLSQRPGRRHLMVIQPAERVREKDVKPRLNMMENEIGAKFAKRFAAAV
jgi:hypothetical protein